MQNNQSQSQDSHQGERIVPPLVKLFEMKVGVPNNYDSEGGYNDPNNLGSGKISASSEDTDPIIIHSTAPEVVIVYQEPPFNLPDSASSNISDNITIEVADSENSISRLARVKNYLYENKFSISALVIPNLLFYTGYYPNQHSDQAKQNIAGIVSSIALYDLVVLPSLGLINYYRGMNSRQNNQAHSSEPATNVNLSAELVFASPEPNTSAQSVDNESTTTAVTSNDPAEKLTPVTFENSGVTRNNPAERLTPRAEENTDVTIDSLMERLTTEKVKSIIEPYRQSKSLEI